MPTATVAGTGVGGVRVRQGAVVHVNQAQRQVARHLALYIASTANREEGRGQINDRLIQN